LQLYVERQKLSLKGEAKALDDDAVLAAAGVRDGSELEVKDLGPQVSWRTVFLVEYVRLFSLPISFLDNKEITQKMSSGWPTRHPSDSVLSAKRVLRARCATQRAANVCVRDGHGAFCETRARDGVVRWAVFLGGCYFGPADFVLPFFLFSVHRFSHATMPRRNIFKKYAFYCLELSHWLTLV
jgi:hypothetical protein